MNVLITGASSGLGEALAKAFSQQGWQVAGTTLDPSEANNFSLFPWNALEMGSIDRLLENLKPRFGSFEVVINNAGINAICEFKNLNAGFIHDILQVNTVAPVLLVQGLLAGAFLKRGTRICNVISDAAWRPMRHSLAYNVSKAGLDIATKQMARELTKPYGLSVFGVRPGKMSGTGMSRYIDQQVCKMRGWTPDQAMDYFKAGSVTGLEMDPTATARFIYQLCTSGLPISGACLDLCG